MTIWHVQMSLRVSEFYFDNSVINARFYCRIHHPIQWFSRYCWLESEISYCKWQTELIIQPCCWLFLDHLRAISVLIADLTPIICDQLSDQEANSGRPDCSARPPCAARGFPRHFLRRRRAAFGHFLSNSSSPSRAVLAQPACAILYTYIICWLDESGRMANQESTAALVLMIEMNFSGGAAHYVTGRN